MNTLILELDLKTSWSIAKMIALSVFLSLKLTTYYSWTVVTYIFPHYTIMLEFCTP